MWFLTGGLAVSFFLFYVNDEVAKPKSMSSPQPLGVSEILEKIKRRQAQEAEAAQPRLSPQVPAPTPETFPATGTVERFTRKPGLAPLTIITSAGSNYYVKLFNTASNENVLAVYVVGGYPISIQAPLGSYELRYACGTTWCGSQDLFGPQTTCSRADSTFTFAETADGYTGYTVQLIMQQNGNLSTSSLNKANF